MDSNELLFFLFGAANKGSWAVSSVSLKLQKPGLVPAVLAGTGRLSLASCEGMVGTASLNYSFLSSLAAPDPGLEAEAWPS